MRRSRRAELYPADRGLQARMVAVAVLTPAIVFGSVAASVLFLPHKILIGLGLGVAFGLLIGGRSDHGTFELLGPGEEPELQEIVDRLCLSADLPRPEIALVDEPQPNSWIVDAPTRTPRLYVTAALLDLLDPSELEAVVAHELSHVAHRDAAVMTVVGVPGAVLLRGGTFNVGWAPWAFGLAVSKLVGLVAAVGSSALSRHRELIADAGAARLTGRPSALASALLKVSGALALLPAEDLRAVAARDGLHLLAVDDRGGWRRILVRTHPSVERRVAALARLEHGAAHARRVPSS